MAIECSAQDDVDRLAHDPAFRAAVWDRNGDQVVHERLANQPTQSRLISKLTRNSANSEAVRDGLARGVENHVIASGGRHVAHATIDIDSFPNEVHGKQHGAAYNGYSKRSMYHPLVASLSVGGDYDSVRDGKRRALDSSMLPCDKGKFTSPMACSDSSTTRTRKLTRSPNTSTIGSMPATRSLP